MPKLTNHLGKTRYVQVIWWVKKFMEDQEELEDDPHFGRPSTSQIDENVSRVCNLLNFNRRMSVRLLNDIEHSKNRCASHCYGRIKHTKGVHRKY
jgi:hypothetical protein